METEDTGAQLDGRVWDVSRLLRTGDVMRARVESALLIAEAERVGDDWVVEQVQHLWTARESRRTA